MFRMGAMSPLERAIDHAGGLSALARAIGKNTLPQHIINWRNRGVPPDRCVDIERATDGVITRAQLRPDIFGKATA